MEDLATYQPQTNLDFEFERPRTVRDENEKYPFARVLLLSRQFPSFAIVPLEQFVRGRVSELTALGVIRQRFAFISDSNVAQ